MRRQALVLTGIGLVVLLAAVSPDAEAQAARVVVTVKDVAGHPIEGVTVTATCAAKGDYRIVKTTNNKGTATVTHVDSLQTYHYELAKDGYETQSRDVQPDYTQTTKLELALLSRVPVAGVPAEPPAPSGRGRALTAFTEGAAAQKAGDLDLAETKFRQAAELSPDAPEPHIALSVVAHERGAYAEAAAEAEAALAISPTNAQAMFLRYDAYRLTGETDKAAAAAAALRQSGAASLAAEEVFRKGIDAYRGGNIELAVEKFRQSIDLDPRFVNGYVMLGNVSLKQGDATQAAALAGKALELEPGNANALKVRYDALRRLGDEAGASQALDALIAGDPEWASTELYNHAVELFNANEMTGAAAALERVVEAKPGDARAHFLLGMAKYNIGDAEDAKTHLTRFLELAPNDPDAALAREMLSYAQP
jgi:tetratricopeptide (TPR) repeat protein